MAGEVGAERTGIRLAPFITQRNMNCPQIIETILHLASRLDEIGLAYIHLSEADWDDAPEIPQDFRHALRRAYQGKVIVAGKYDAERAQTILHEGLADLVAFGRPFIANPDLPARYAAQAPPLHSIPRPCLAATHAATRTTQPSPPPEALPALPSSSTFESTTMKAVGYQKPQAISQPESLIDITLPDPVATGRDLLVEVRAVSVNPVDTKVRASGARRGQTHKVLGWDASGIVKAVGPEVTLFKPGDRVWYAGSIARPGTNSELHLVDERIVGHAPKSLDFAQAAALP